MATAGQEQQPGTLDNYAKELHNANDDLQVQTQYFETIRNAVQVLAAFAQDNSKGVKGLPIVVIKDRKNPDARGIELDLDVIGPQAALTIKPFLEMAAGAVGAALQQSWGKVNQVNTNAQQVLQVANRLQHEAEQQQRHVTPTPQG
jgi:hypothetical protein